MKTYNELRKKIINTNGRLFGVEFVKKDGSLRKMCCRLGVKKGVKGVEPNRAEQDYEHNLMTVYDFNANRTDESKGGFRRINLSTVQSFTIDGVKDII